MARDAFWEFSSSLINFYSAKCFEKRCREIIESKLNDTQCGLRHVRSTADHISLCRKILRNLRSMLKTSSHALSTSRKHTIGFLVKSFGECSVCTVLTAACYCMAIVTPLVWHFATNCAAVKFVEPWVSNHFSELREHNYVSSATYPECSTKDWWGKSCWLNPRENDPDVVQGPVGLTTSSTLLGPVLVWSQHNYQKCLLIVRYFKSS